MTIGANRKMANTKKDVERFYKRYIKLIWIGICITISAITIFSIVATQKYVFYDSDDFIGLKEVRELDDLDVFEYFEHDIKHRVEAWNTWQGAYGGLFFSFFTRLSYMNPNARVIIRMVEILLFFFMMLMYLSYTIKRTYDNKILQLTFSTAVLWSFVNFKSFYQAYFWPNTINIYVACFGCLMCALFFLYKLSDNNKTMDCILACVLAVIAMGGNQCIVLSGCYLALLEVIKDICDKRLKKKELIVFGFFVIAGSLNAFAPGHINRHSYIESDGSFHFLKAIGWAIRDDLIYSEEYFKDTIFLAICLVMVLAGFFVQMKISRGNMVKLVLFMLIPMVSLYPACLGYSSSYMQNRVRFIAEFWIIVRFLLLSLFIGTFLRRIVEDRNRRLASLFFCLLIIISSFLSPWKIEDGQVYKLLSAMGSGQLESYKKAVDNILREIEESPDDDVVTSDLPEKVEGFIEFLYTDDPKSYTNECLSYYYGKNTVRAKGDREYNTDADQ